MKWGKAFLLLIVALMLPTFAAAQQNDFTEVELSDGYTILIPDGWMMQTFEDTPGKFAYHEDGERYIHILTPSEIADLVDLSSRMDAADVVEASLLALYDFEARTRDIEDLEIAGYPAASLTLIFGEDNEFESATIVVDYGDGLFGYFDVNTDAGELEGFLDDALEVIATFSGDDIDTSVASSSDANTSAACFVSTDQERTVQLRVGPGSNRGVATFMPAGETFTVTGRFEADDASVWFQLDKEEVAPNSAAAELWVAEEDVETSGNCDAVVDASAPPVIPGSQPPANPPASSGGEGSGADNSGSESSTSSEGDIIPVGGSWTMVLDATTNASCQGGSNVSFNTSEIFSRTSYTYSISVRSNALVIGGSTFEKTGVNTYRGSVDLSGGMNSQFYITVISSTQMRGGLVVNFSGGSVPCSATIGATLTKN